MVRQADLARARLAAAAHQRHRAGGMVRRAERALQQQPAVRAEHARRAVDARRFQRLLERHVRQNARQAARHHRLAAARRADHQHVVPARRGDLQRALGALLPAHVRKVVPRPAALQQLCIGHGRHRLDVRLAAQVVDDLREAPGGQHAQPLHAGGLAGVVRGEDECGKPALLRRNRHGKRAAHGHQLAGEGQFAHRRRARQTLGGHHAAGAQDRQRDGQVIGRALLAHVGGREVDRQPRDGEGQRAGGHRRAHALTALLDGGVRQADDLEHRQAVRGERLDRDEIPLDAG